MFEFYSKPVRNPFWRILVVGAGLLPWIAYGFSLPVGLESLIDEGQMLLLPNRPKPLGHLGSQSGVLIGAITDHFSYEARTLVWTRYILQCISVASLLVSSLVFLRSRVTKKIDSLVYTGFFLLVSSMGLYLFTKTVSYNHIQQFCVLLSVSLFLIYRTYLTISWVRVACLLGMGFFSCIGILNIAPSGVAFAGFLLVILIAEVRFSWKKSAMIVLSFAGGIALGFVFFHFFVKDLGALVQEVVTMYSMVNKLNRSYDSFSLLYKFAKSLLSLFQVCLLTAGILYLYEVAKTFFGSRLYAGILAAFSMVCAITYSVNFTETGELFEWLVAPLLLTLVFNYQAGVNDLVRHYRWILIFLTGIPIIAPLGTNLFISYKYGYFFVTWLIAILILYKGIEVEYKRIITGLLFFVALSWNIAAFGRMYRNLNECSAQTMTLKRLSNIYITPKQKNYFEGVYAHLQANHFSEGDTIIAFQPDLMTVFAVGGTAGHRVYFVPSDFLNDDLSYVGRPKYLILNEYSYGQISPLIKEKWGFPDKYQKIDIGSPETSTYFDAHKSRMLFCLKDVGGKEEMTLAGAPGKK
jgi:hypothetical protein